MYSGKKYKGKSSGSLIRELRKAAGLTQEQLAGEIDCDPQTISNVENDRYLSADIALKISKRFRVPVDYILGKIDSPDEYSKMIAADISLMSQAAKAQETLVDYLVASENNRKLKLTEAEKQELIGEMIWYGRMRLRKIISERSGNDGEESKKSR